MLYCLAGWSSAFGSERCEPRVARVVSVEGQVERRAAGTSRRYSVQRDEVFCQGDEVLTGANSRAALILDNGTILRLDQNTTASFSGMQADQSSRLDLIEGIAHFISRLRQAFRVVTPFVNAAIEGTEFVVEVRSRSSAITVFEGRVAAANSRGTVLLTSGQTAVATASTAPVLQTTVKPRDAVQWALYYPGILPYDARRFAQLPEPWRTRLQQSVGVAQAGDTPAALQVLDGLPESRPELLPLYTYRASLRLDAGRVRGARNDLASALAIDPGDSDALALLAIIAVVQNRSAEALEQARKALSADPANPAASLALSYAQQARFDVEGALETLQRAVSQHPEDALLQARLAELYLSVGDLDQALAAARRASAVDPTLARTQNVLGFAWLARIRPEQARAAFERAIRYDQSDPLARLGLGLAEIRQGHLRKGRGQIELAASLDPDNSLIRSYLGKAYFDERRNGVAAAELRMAKRLDPDDPTPWFYDALRKQSVNRPVEALQDLQKSIELNDNRAVFRSKFLLDDDLAARSSSLARIYTDLGFDQLARTEGWKAVNAAPDNYSAHRFLADAYAGRPRHEVARVSELLQSQLLQPLNVTPLQPRLGESNLLLLAGQGPAAASFNEFNPLFVRNGLSLQASGIAGNKDSLGDELTLSGIHNNLSWSLGQLHYETDGFRDNNDQDTDLYNAFFQASLSPALNVQAEYRRREIGNGDLSLNGDPDNFNPDYKRDLTSDTWRVGARLSPGNRSDFIASFIYQDETEKQKFGFFDARVKTDGYLAEGQYLFRGKGFTLTAGGGYYDADNDARTSSAFFRSDFSLGTRQGSGYLYSRIDLPRAVTAILGASYDSQDNDQIDDENQFNPKIGVMWQPTDATLVRAAAFRVLKRSLLTDQTIEPTQVAGFNQFFDDRSGTDAWKYGIALDQQFSQKLYAGAEFSRRDLDVPVATTGSSTEDWQEDSFEAYLNWTPGIRYAASLSFRIEDFDADAPGSLVADTRTASLPVDLRYFHPSGFFAGVTTTWVDQDVHSNDDKTKDSDRFTLVDASIGYRLPRRYGILSVGVRNVFDKRFDYQDTGFRTVAEENPPFIPERTIAARLTVSFD